MLVRRVRNLIGCPIYKAFTTLTRSVNLRYLTGPVKAIKIKGKGDTHLFDSAGQRLMEMFHHLLNHFGPQKWWPAQTELEMMVGAVLTQNTNWKNVEKAIENLKRGSLLSLRDLRLLSISELAEAIRPAGYFNIKARRLKNFLQFLFKEYQGRLISMQKEPWDDVREKLLGVNGIGPETADSILLYAFEKPLTR